MDNHYLVGGLLIALLDLGERGYTELHINNKPGEYTLFAKNPLTGESIDLFEVQLDGLKELHENQKGSSPVDFGSRRGDIMFDTIRHALAVIVQRSVKPTDRPAVLVDLIEEILIPLEVKQTPIPMTMNVDLLKGGVAEGIADMQRAITLMTVFSGKESDNNG